ncbi:MAG: UDP-N-acetylglucosamine 2-epimerase (non-hydrolyzing) [Planctomycetia bacterium]|nr:UDP-N-acetylglucosamine 2-epimerase (non-hydrolyzing) [Planctomycetia bacterium]
MRKIILFIFGTRPEAVKMAPVIRVFKNYPELYNTQVCITSQHKSMLRQIMEILDISYDQNLDIMKKDQSLARLSSRLINKLNPIISDISPELVFVQGDTTSAMIGSLIAFYHQIPVAHIEAGLRTYNKYSPFPEEVNRSMISRVSDFHFAPTDIAKNNLLAEGIMENKIWVTGNTVIDSLLWVQKTLLESDKSYFEFFKRSGISFEKKIILVTGHRRENFGNRFQNICIALRQIIEQNDVDIVFPVHLNPNVYEPAHSIIGNVKEIHLLEPLEYDNFLFLLTQCHFVLTDSGGIQEEAPTFDKPVLVMRDNTERPEGIEAGTSLLVGTNSSNIVKHTSTLLNDSSIYDNMSVAVNPFGDGKASKRIFDVINEYSRTKN